MAAPVSLYGEPLPTATSASSHPIPPKFFQAPNGEKQINPAYLTYMQEHGRPTNTLGVAKPFPVVSSKKESDEWEAIFDQKIEFTPATDEAIRWFKSAEVTQKTHTDPANSINQIETLLEKYGMPIGSLSMLKKLAQFDKCEFIIDDSYSMEGARWEEAKQRLKVMIEFLGHLPVGELKIRFLNRKNVMTLERKNLSPSEFIANAWEKIDEEFAKPPSGSTPAFETLQQSFREAPRDQKIARYFFGDGIPNGGDKAKALISNLLKNRPNPQNTPVTFLSCTENPADVEWMEEMEQVAPFCSTLDDYASEAKQVLKEQGPHFAYSYGFHILCELVGAIHPDTLDALDESIPLTKVSLDDLSGFISTEDDYRNYFYGFVNAQSEREVKTPMDAIKQRFNWMPLILGFLTAALAKFLPEVDAFKNVLKEAHEAHEKVLAEAQIRA